MTSPSKTEPMLQGLWHLADPKISITSVAALLIGTAVAVHDHRFAPGWLAITFAALFCMEVAKNAWGEVIDFDSGVDQAVAPEDRTPFSGGKRVMVDGLLTRKQTWTVAAFFGFAGLALGALIVFLREPSAIWIGLIAVLCGWSYHGPPLKLAYRGLGELDVVLCYGPLMVLSVYLIQAQQLSMDAFWLSLPLGLMIAAFLLVNEFPDFLADRSGAKNNLVARLGRRRASWLLPLVYLLAFVLLALILLLTDLPSAVCFGFLALPFAVYASVWTLLRPEDFYRSRPVQPAALLGFVVYSLGCALGVMLG